MNQISNLRDHDLARVDSREEATSEDANLQTTPVLGGQ